MNSKTIAAILEIARRYPSGDNCQPFQAVWDQQKLHIYHLNDRGEHPMNAHNHASLVSLGAMLECIRVAALAQGWQAHYRRPDSWNEIHLNDCGHIEFTEVPPSADLWVKEIKRRETNRQQFTKSLMTERNLLLEVFAQQKSQSWFTDTKVTWFWDVSDSMASDLANAESLSVAWTDTFKGLLKWTRLTQGEIDATDDGLSWQNLGVKWFEVFGLRLARSSDFFLTLLSPMVRQSYQAEMKSKLLAGDGLVALSVGQSTPEAFVQLGRSMLQLSLILANMGFAMQPLTCSSLLIAVDILGWAKLPPQLRDQLALLAPKIQRHLNWDVAQQPVMWTFRIGKTERLAGKARTKRLPLDAWLRFETATNSG